MPLTTDVPPPLPLPRRRRGIRPTTTPLFTRLVVLGFVFQSVKVSRLASPVTQHWVFSLCLGIPPQFHVWTSTVYSGFSSRLRLQRSAGKGVYALRPVSQQFPEVALEMTNVGLVRHRSFPTPEGGACASPFLHSS